MSVQASVIIPVYNAADTIDRCVESLVYGEERDIEIILIDDCSTDSSLDKCRALEEKYANVICGQNEKNRGVSYTRNKGLEKANGKYILFVDSDDWVSGNYIKQLIEEAEKSKDALILCGYHYVDYTMEEEQINLYDTKVTRNIIESKDFFILDKVILLKQLWNKIFRREIIEKYCIRFDEKQCMGEDFQFVLDYMEVMKCTRCVVLNEALYYYVRVNSLSLMGKFGVIKSGNEFERLEKLLKISGEYIPEVQVQYNNAVENTKRSYVYFCVRTCNKNKNEKIALIEDVMQDGRAFSYYRKERMIMLKECLIMLKNQIPKNTKRIKGRFRRAEQLRFLKEMRSKLKNDEFSIISQNCIGGVFYHDMKKEFLTPTINLFIKEPDFVKFVLNLPDYMNMELRMHWEEYPVGSLGDIKIHFMHYATCTEAKEAWDRRKKRIKYDKLVVVATDRNGFGDDVFEDWKKIQYPKVLFTVNEKFETERGSVLFKEYQKNNFVPDLVPKREFYKDDILMNTINSI